MERGSEVRGGRESTPFFSRAWSPASVPRVPFQPIQSTAFMLSRPRGDVQNSASQGSRVVSRSCLCSAQPRDNPSSSRGVKEFRALASWWDAWIRLVSVRPLYKLGEVLLCLLLRFSGAPDVVPKGSQRPNGFG